MTCGECYFCKNGKRTFCENNIGLGTTVDGSLQNTLSCMRNRYTNFLKNLNFIEAAMAEPISCCLNAIDRVISIDGPIRYCDRLRSDLGRHALLK